MSPSNRRRMQLALVLGTLLGVVLLRALTNSAAEPDVVRPPVPTIAGTAGSCERPAEVELPAWYPADLPLPRGSYATEVQAGDSGINVVTLVVPRPFERTIGAIVRAWDAEGWNLGAGEREPWEAENVFWKQDDRYGRFRILKSCDVDRTIVTLALTDGTA